MLLLDYKPWNWLRILLCPLPLREGSSIRLARPGPASLAGIRWSEPEQRVPKHRESVTLRREWGTSAPPGHTAVWGCSQSWSLRKDVPLDREHSFPLPLDHDILLLAPRPASFTMDTGPEEGMERDSGK